MKKKVKRVLLEVAVQIIGQVENGILVADEFGEAYATIHEEINGLEVECEARIRFFTEDQGWEVAELVGEVWHNDSNYVEGPDRCYTLSDCDCYAVDALCQAYQTF